ncbi:MAG: hybrid sensor histidine kinase/response regulator [Desulfarculus sp.]|jgi:signal transduction histidine kinase|nr:MAG: hybrid sensor histidine kinase/response regulator [Desulfarculus sp.]
MAPGPQAHILCIDDDEIARESAQVLLSRWGHRVSLASSGQAGLELMQQDPPDLVLVDLQMPGLNGLQVLERVSLSHPDVILIMVTGHATLRRAVEAMKQGAYDFISKPFPPDELRLAVERGLERRRLILETKALREEKARMEANFMTLVSHQMCSPLAAVRQLLEVPVSQARGPLPPAYQDFIVRAVTRLDLLIQSINAWLAMSRLDEEGIDERKIDAPFSQIIKDLVRRVEDEARLAGQGLEVQAPSEDCVLEVDLESLREALYNLASNAVKYNQPRGRVLIKGRILEHQVEIAIGDQGPGIPEKEQAYIFNEFYRSKSREIKSKPGSGLGLSIARRVIRAHGGDIIVNSAPGQGATFTVVLPR